MMGRNDPTEILQEIDGINLVLSIWSEREIEMGSRIARLGQGFEVASRMQHSYTGQSVSVTSKCSILRASELKGPWRTVV